MLTFKFDPHADSGPVLDRVIKAYGFSSKLMLAQHLDIAASSLSSRYKRGGFPADIAVRCVAETGVSLAWLATGSGARLNDEQLAIITMPRQKITDGRLDEAGTLMLDKANFLSGKPLPQNPLCIIDRNEQYIIEQHFTEICDDKWLVQIEGKISIRTLTLIPIKRIRISGADIAFDCSPDDIKLLGRVVLTIK